MVNFFAISLLIKNGKTLLARRCNASFGNGMYSLIGGKVEAGESGLQGIKREVFEETGLEIPIEKFELVHTFCRKGTEGVLVALCFRADISLFSDPYNKEPLKHDDFRFFILSDLPINILSAHKKAIQCIEQGIIYSEQDF